MSNRPLIPEIQHFQNLTLKIKGQGHGWGHSLSHNDGLTSYRLTSLLFHVNRASHSWVMTFLKFDLENQGHGAWVRSQFKVTMWVYHPIDSHPFRSMSIGPPILEIQHFQNLTLEIKGQGHWWGHSSKSHCEWQHFHNLTFKMKSQGQMTIMLHNCRSRQFHRTSNRINPFSGFKDMGSAKSGPSAAWFEKFLAPGGALLHWRW